MLKLNKIADSGKCYYSWYDTRFDACGCFPMSNGSRIIKKGLLCLGNILKHFLLVIWKQTQPYEYVYDFSANFSIDDYSNVVDGILGIHEYLMKKNNINYGWIYEKENMGLLSTCTTRRVDI